VRRLDRAAPHWPRIAVTLTHTSGHVVFADGPPHHFRGRNLDDTRSQATTQVADITQRYGSPLIVHVTEPDTAYEVTVPAGAAFDRSAPDERRSPRLRRPQRP
jgi:hypothetical protein